MRGDEVPAQFLWLLEWPVIGAGILILTHVVAPWRSLTENDEYALGEYRRGNMYHYGYDKDSRKAMKHFLKAAEHGNVDAQFHLAASYGIKNCDLNDDQAAVRFLNAWKAGKWYRRAADQGHAEAQCDFGWMHDTGRGTARDAKEAVRWYRKSADQGLAEAQYRLGINYANGRGVLEDCKKAVKWYRKAADQGYGDAQFNLGVMYANGRGVLKDGKEAVKWYRKAADQGLTKAQYSLGVMYESGSGIVKDEEEAMKWYRKSADQGYAKAQSKIPKSELVNRRSGYARKREQWSEELGENFSAEDRTEIRKAFGNECFKCGSTVRLQVDHHYPISKRHPLTLKNATLLCKECNYRKCADLPEDFYTSTELERRSKIIDKLTYGDE
jgi:hypothetical protein